jgi:hypothetical protein
LDKPAPVLSPHYLQRKEDFVQPFFLIKPWQTPVNKAKGKKEGTKREDPTPGLKDKTQSESQRGK